MKVIKYKVVIRCDKNRVEYPMYKLSHICIYILNYILKMITRYMKLETKY